MQRASGCRTSWRRSSVKPVVEQVRYMSVGVISKGSLPNFNVIKNAFSDGKRVGNAWGEADDPPLPPREEEDMSDELAAGASG